MTPITRQSWAEIYADEFPTVYRALLATLRNRELALDALHDAFAAGLARSPVEQNIAGWLFRVALRQARRGPYRTRWHSLRDELVAPARDDHLAALLDRMEVARLVGMLSERQRAIVVAEYYLGLTQDEIAVLFGVRRGTVAATLAQARARMRQGEGRVG